MRLLVCACLLAACGDNGVGGDDDSGESLVAGLSVRSVVSMAPDAVVGISVVALDEHRLAVARADTTGTAFCPDCVDLDPSQCPSLCERSLISVAMLDAATGAFDKARPVATVFPRSFDHSVDQVELVSLRGDRVGVAWLDCDNSRCGGLFAKRSCTARYATVNLTTGAVGTERTLYEGWFGDLSLAFSTTTSQLLAVVGKDLAFGAGLFRAIYDESGATVISPWAPLGSTAARSPAIIATGGGFVVAADDWSPNKAPLASPCTESCNCLAAGDIDIGTGGLFAFHVGGGTDRVERVAAGVDDRGFYARREQIAVIDAGGRLLIADTQSIDRSAELFTSDGSGWIQRMRAPAPIPMWIGALGTADHFAWIGAEPEPGQSATVQRLVAGVVAGGAEERATFTEPLDRHVFAAIPVVTPAGVTTTYLLQGLFAPRMGDQLGWERFELVAIDAAW